MDEKKVKELAEKLKNQGLAVSMYEATEKAKSILGVEIGNSGQTEQKTTEQEDRFSKEDFDVKNEKGTVNDLMEEIGVTADQIKEQEKKTIDEITEVKEDIMEAVENPEKTPQAEDTSKSDDEIDEILEVKSEDIPDVNEPQEDKPDDVSQENKKETSDKDAEETETDDDEEEDDKKNHIDLSKIFDTKK